MSNLGVVCPRAASVRVLVADSSRMGSQLIVDALSRDPGFDMLPSCSSSREVLSRASEGHPTVCVISANLDDQLLKGLEVCKQLRTHHPEVSVVMLLDSSKRELVVNSFAAGARAIFCRSDSIEALRKCVHAVHDGQVWASSNEMRYVLDALSERVPHCLVDSKGTVLLSKREQDVVRCVTEGLTNREIALQLKLSEHTVKNYVFRIFEKLGVSTRVEVVLYAFSQRAHFAGLGPAVKEKPVTEFEYRSKAAEQGNGAAQLRLAEIYREGTAVPRDNVAALMWLMVAEGTAIEVESRSSSATTRLVSKMSPEEIKEATRRAEEWLKRSLLRADSPPPNGRHDATARFTPTSVSKHVSSSRAAGGGIASSE